MKKKKRKYFLNEILNVYINTEWKENTECLYQIQQIE